MIRKFTVGNAYKDSAGWTQGQRNAAYKNLKLEMMEKLGIDHLPYGAPYEIMELKEIFYYRPIGHSLFALLPGRSAPEDEEVACSCGNKSFYIEYGSWECIGTCVVCRENYVLYDG